MAFSISSYSSGERRVEMNLPRFSFSGSAGLPTDLGLLTFFAFLWRRGLKQSRQSILERDAAQVWKRYVFGFLLALGSFCFCHGFSFYPTEYEGLLALQDNRIESFPHPLK
jgi:hypothetical protein